VAMIETKENIIITSYFPLTQIKTSITLNKKTWVMNSSVLDKNLDNVKKTKFYSLFMGLLKHDGKYYMIFAEKVFY